MALEDEMSSLRHMRKCQQILFIFHQRSRIVDDADLSDLRSQSVSNDLDPSQFFRNELAQAIREIRGDYESRVENQRSDMQNRYLLAYNELVIRQNQPNVNPLQNEQQRRQEERLRTEVSQTQNQTGYLRAKNQDVKNRIEDLQRRLAQLRDDGGQSQARVARDIQDARQRLEQANRDFTEVTNLKTSLEKEITTYRDLLESKTMIFD